MRREETVGHAVRTLNNLLQRNFLAAARKAGMDEITCMHGWIIGYLYDHADEVVCQRDLEARFSVGRSAITSVLQRMEAKEFVTRRPVPGDGRLKCLCLTDKGRQMHEQAMGLISTLDAENRRDISPEEMAAFFATVAKLKENLRRQLTPNLQESRD